MFGGSLTYLGPDGLLLTLNNVDEGEVNISGGIATLTGINLDASASDVANTNNPLLSLTGGALYLGGVGLYDPDSPQLTTNEVVLGGGILGAFTNWDASTVNYIELTNTATVQAADALGNAWNIELDGLVWGTGNLTKTGGGTLLLTSNETYTGHTIISAGTLALGQNPSGNATLASSAIAIAGGATFNVSGLSSTFTLAHGQTLGNTTSTGAVVGSINDASGGLVLNYSSGTPSLSVSSGTLTLNSTTAVTVTNTGAALVAGNTYTLIASGVAGTAPSSVTLAGNVAGVAGTLQISGGALKLVASVSALPAKLTGISVSGTTLTISAVNGAPSGQFTLLESTNLLLPLNQWTPVLTNNLNASGALVNFSTNIINPASPQEFYLLQMP
jgi:autotransporter-associated beta strand protein